MKNIAHPFHCRRLVLALAAAFALPPGATFAADYIVGTYAGSGSPTSRDGVGTIGVKFSSPAGVAIDASGNVYVADQANHQIRKISTAGVVTTLAGSGVSGYADGSGLAATFAGPRAVAIDASGNVFVADANNNRIRKVSAGGIVTTLAGDAAGYADGTGVAARFISPSGIAVDTSGNIYVSDRDNQRMRRIDSSGVVTTLAGSGTAAFADGSGSAASFSYPTGISINALGDLLIADTNNYRIRKLSATGIVSTVAGDGSNGYFDGTGTASAFGALGGVAIDASGNVFVADTSNQRIRKIEPSGVVSTLAGNATAAYVDGSGSAASFNFPNSLVINAAGEVIVADRNNNMIRKIDSSNNVTTFAGSKLSYLDGTGVASEFKTPYGVATDASGNLYVADSSNHMIRKITAGGVVTTFAGNGSSGYQDGTGTAASFYNPTAVAADTNGNVYVADQNNQRIRKITSSGSVTTIAGDGTSGFLDATGTAARFNNPAGIAVDVSGNIYVSDFSNHRIRKIDGSGAVTSLAGAGTSGSSDGSGVAAHFNNPSGIVVTSTGTIFVADRSNNTVRRITPSGVVTTLAGTGSQGAVDGAATGASFYYPNGLAVDVSGNLYVADSSNNRIRRIGTNGVVSTLAGQTTAGYVDATGNAAKFSNPSGIAMGSFGTLYVADTNNSRIRSLTSTLATPVFSSVSNASPGSQVSSGAYTVSGVGSTVTGSISCPVGDSGCGYTINGGALTSGSNTLNEGDVIIVRVTAANTYATTVQATMTVGWVQGTFSVTTAAAPADNTPPPVVVPPVVIPPLPPSVTITPVTNPSTVFTGATGATIDPSTGVVVLATTSTAPIVLNSTVPDNVGIKPTAGTAYTITNSAGGSVKITGLTADTLLVTRKVGNTTLIEVASGTARIEPTAGTAIPLASKGDQSVGTLSPSGSTPTAVIVRRNDQGINAFIETGTTVYKTVASNGSSTPDATVYGGETANFTSQGGINQVKIGSLDGDRNLPGDPLKNIPNVDPGLIVPQLDGKINRLGGQSIIDSFKNQIDAALGSPPGAEVSFDPASGVVVYKVNGLEARFIPLGNLLVSLTGFADNGFVATSAGQAATGTFNLIDRGVQLTLASTLGYFNDFNAAIQVSDPTGKVTLKASGAIWIDMQGAQYITQPGFLAESSAVTGKPGLLVADNGQLSFRDSKGSVQALYPTLADGNVLQATLAKLVPDAALKPQGDGTAAATLGGHSYIVAPQYNLIAIPGKYAGQSWWADGGTIYYSMPALNKAQGFSVK